MLDLDLHRVCGWGTICRSRRFWRSLRYAPHDPPLCGHEQRVQAERHGGGPKSGWRGLFQSSCNGVLDAVVPKVTPEQQSRVRNAIELYEISREPSRRAIGANAWIRSTFLSSGSTKPRVLGGGGAFASRPWTSPSLACRYLSKSFSGWQRKSRRSVITASSYLTKSTSETGSSPAKGRKSPQRA